MDRVIETSLKPKKEWNKPELKKIDIEQITTTTGLFPLTDAKHTGSKS
jgi:hypothetical protein